MKVKQIFMLAAFALVAIAALPLKAATIPTSNWVVHNGTSTITNNGDSPTFTPAGSQLTVMSPFEDIELLQPGQFIRLEAELQINGRAAGPAANPNSLNTQLRIGLFDGPDGAVVGPPTPDVPNHGIIIEYSNAGGLLRAQKSNTEPNPFLNIPVANNINNATHTGGSIQGVNPGPISIELTLTRAAGDTMNIAGTISGMDGVTPYQSTYAFSGYVPTGVGFSFNRVGFHFGNNVQAQSASLINARIVTNVPEPGTIMLVATTLLGGVLAGRRRRAS